MVRDEVLWFSDPCGQLADAAIAECELTQQHPPLRIGNQLQEPDGRRPEFFGEHVGIYIKLD